MKAKNLVVTVMIITMAVLVAPALAALGSAGPVHPVNGFPVWYQDTAGMIIEQCFEPDNPMCLADPVMVGNAFSEQIGFGGEAFWWTTEALMDSKIADGTAGNALMVLAMEAAFLNEDPAPGDQITFGRLRLFVDVPVAGRYKITHPFGVSFFDVSAQRIAGTNGVRAINANLLTASGYDAAASTDIPLGDHGCEVAPCDFSLALGSGIGPFLTWDNFAQNPPALRDAEGRRYVGNPLIEHAITGSPFGTNFFRIEGPAGVDLDPNTPGTQNIIETLLFSVSGRIADTVPPVLLAEAHPSQIEAVTGSAVLHAHLTDDMSGVGTVTVDLGAIGMPETEMTLISGSLTDGTWAITADNIDQLGTFVLPVMATDRTGNSVLSATTLAVSDTTAPSIVLSDDHADAVVRDADNILITATFTEALSIDEVNAPRITIGSVVTSAAMTKANNLVWTYMWDVPAGNENAAVTVTASDTAGNPNSPATGKIAYVIDNTAPDAPAVTSPPGVVYVKADNFTISGTAEANSFVKIYDPAGAIAGMEQLSGGSTVFGVAVPLIPDSVNAFTATATDAAGNEGSAAAVSIIEARSGLTVELGYNLDRPVRDIDSLTVTATFSGATSPPAGTPAISIDYAGTDSDVSGAPMTGAGNIWTFTADIPAGNDGTSAVTIFVLGADGEPNHPASNNQFTVDNTAPDVVLSDDHADAVVRDADNILITATSTEAIDEANIPKITIGTVVTDAAMTGAGNVWTYLWDVPAGNDGEAAVSITAFDAAGNPNSAATGKTGYVIDNIAPAAPVVTSPSVAVAINADMHAIEGAAEADSLVKVYNSTLDIVASQQLADGATAFIIDVPLVQDAMNAFTVTATDTAGNEDPSVPVPNVMEDSTFPSISSIALSSVTQTLAVVAWNTDELSDSAVFYGTTGAAVLNATDSANVTSHSISLSGLSAGTLYLFNVSSCDAAGNCNTSVQLSFTTPAPPAPSGGGGGGSSGGGGGGASIGPASSRVASLVEPNDVVLRITVNLTTTVSGPALRATELSSVPVPAPDSLVYLYLNITKVNFDNINIGSASVEFRVSRAWLDSNNISEVYLMRFSNGWSRVRTEHLRTDGDIEVYRGYPDGFSYFAIAGEVAKTAPAAEQTAQSAPAEQSTDLSVTSRAVTGQATSAAGIGIGAAIGGLIAIGWLAYLVPGRFMKSGKKGKAASRAAAIVTVIVVIAAVALALVYYQPASAPAGNVVEITAAGFSPETITINPGDSVTWVNKDGAPHWPASAQHPTHTIYPEGGGCIGSKFDACRGLGQGEAFTFRFTQEGTWSYHDHLDCCTNPAFFGMVVVAKREKQPTLTVSAQSLSGGQINIDGLYLDKPGYAVIHKDVSGTPGQVIGYSELASGEKTNLKVAIDVSQAGSSVFVMLHYDDDNDGVYGFPDEDKPVLLEGNVVVKPVAIL